MRWYGSLRRRAEIAYVRRNGRSVGGPRVAAYALRGSGRSRVAISAAKTLGGAVVRNRVRRRLKGALDAEPAPQVALRLVLIARPAAAAAPYAALARAVAEALERLAARPPE